MTDESLELTALFFSAFISSTIAPGGSEAVLALMLSQHKYQAALLIATATIGNTLGALTTWFLGFLAAKRYPAELLLAAKKQKGINWVKKWGQWALFFSWLPVVGDGFCFAGGWLRLSLFSSMLVIFIGKLVRYAAIYFAISSI